MQMIHYGKEHEQVIMLLHGGGLSWWNYKEAAEILQKDYHVILPVLNGHAGSEKPFTTIEEQAEELIDYIDQNHNGEVLLIGGVSLGGQILIEMLSRRKKLCQAAVVESALISPMKLTRALIKPMLEMSYGLIREKWFAKLQFASLKIKQDLFDVYYQDTCRITKESMIAVLQANTAYDVKKEISKIQAKVFLIAGGKENSNILKSARRLNRMIPDSVLDIKKNLYHGSYSINHAEEYAEQVLRILENL